MSMLVRPEVRRAATVDEAVALLAALGPDAAPLAGATWVMRAGLSPFRVLDAMGARDADRVG